MTNAPIPDLPAPLATAQTEGRLTTASILDLHSANGATIPNSTQPVLMVGTSPPPGPMRKVTAFFEGGEHTFLGDQVWLTFEGQSAPTQAASYPILLPNQLKLTYGQIVALSGDFYGFPNRPISGDPTGQTFQDAFDSLARLPASNAEATGILNTMKTEIDAANKAIAQGVDPSTAYDDMGDRLNYSYNFDTGGGFGVVPRGRYLLLAATNWDHFGATAVAAYTIGHNRAQAVAAEAGKLTTPASRRAFLELAYAMNAFADHFLTDLFSSGHLRTPRKEMHDLLVETTGSLCARMMHDEDSCYGLQVTNAKGESWTAYGDKRLRDKVNAENLQRAEAAVQLSANEVWQAFQGIAPATGALQLVPDFAALLANPTNPANGSPLFIVRNGTISKRTWVNDRKDYTWEDFWTSVTTYMMTHWYTNMSACGDREKLMMDRAFLAVATNGADPSLILYDHKTPDTMGPVAVTSVPGFTTHQTNPLMIGDVNRDEVPELINITSDNYVQVFGRSANGAYALLDTFQEPDLGSPGSLVVDANDDGDDRIVRMPLDYETKNIGLKSYRILDGKIAVMQDTRDLGVPQLTTGLTQPDPVLVSIDMNGDGKQQIAMLGNASTPCDSRTTSQSLYLFSADSTGQFSLSWKGDIPITAVTPSTVYPPNQQSNIWVLPVDANGDGKTELAQMFGYLTNPANPDKFFFGMHLYGPDGAGGYKEIAGTFQMGPVPTAMGGLLVADYDGDGCDEIILLGPADLTPNVLLTIWKYQQSPRFHETNWYYQSKVITDQLCPPWASFRGATVVNKHKKGSHDHIVIFWDNGGQLTMRVIGGGKPLRILHDYPLEPSHPRNASYQYYSLEFQGGDVD